VRDLQRRLGAAGFLAPGTQAGVFCAMTVTSVEHFQKTRGLRVSGVCDEATWQGLVEASWSLGDRPLLLRSPNLRGDDVGELQTRLSRLGFHTGRIDGIFGPDTHRAVSEFQRNCGLAADGLCGVETTRLLVRLCRQSGDGPGVAAVHELESLRVERTLGDCRILIGQYGGLGGVARQVIKQLRTRGAHVLHSDDLDASRQATAANRFEADAYLGLEAATEPTVSVAYYATHGFESSGGKELASLLARRFDDVAIAPTAVAGMRLPILRETRMPAVLCTLGPVRSVVDHAPALAEAAAAALERWVRRAPST
jgi:N-acetylmuramoyl-L-alanine amidase